jgi:hypothetical protein
VAAKGSLEDVGGERTPWSGREGTTCYVFAAVERLTALIIMLQVGARNRDHIELKLSYHVREHWGLKVLFSLQHSDAGYGKAWLQISLVVTVADVQYSRPTNELHAF